MNEVAEFNFNGVFLKVVHGDITEEEVDAIVNPANSSLKHGGGVAGAIVKKGGKIIEEESEKIGFVPTGKAVYTTAGNLPAKYVIHTVGPIYGEGDEEEKLKSAITSTLNTAKKLNIKSISIPAISTGIFGYPKKEGIDVIVETVLNRLKAEKHLLKEIRFISIDSETVNLFKVVLERKIS